MRLALPPSAFAPASPETTYLLLNQPASATCYVIRAFFALPQPCRVCVVCAMVAEWYGVLFWSIEHQPTPILTS